MVASESALHSSKPGPSLGGTSAGNKGTASAKREGIEGRDSSPGSVLPESALDRVFDFADAMFDVPIVLLSLLHGEDRYRSTVDRSDADLRSIASAFASTVIEAGEQTVILDAAEEATGDESFLPDDESLRFCAGVPIDLPDGSHVGALCLLDEKPREPTDSIPRLLGELRDMVVREIMLFQERAAREHVETRLRRLENEYETVFQNARDALFLVEVDRSEGDLEFRILRLNETHESLTGLSTEETRGRTPRDLFGEKIGRQVEANYRRCVEERDVIKYEEELPLGEGTSTWETKLSPVIFDGDVTHLVGVSREISQQKDVQRELRESNQRLRLALDAADAGTFAFDVAAEEVEWDERTLEIYGVGGPARRVDATLLDRFVHPEDKGELDEVFYGAVESEKSYEVTYRIRRPDGEVRVVRSHGIVVRDDRGRALRVVGINQDVTERKAFEQRLRMMSEALRQAQEGILITNAQSLDERGPRIVFANPAFEEMTGYGEEEVVGKTPRLLEGPETDRQFVEGLRTAMETGEAWSGETTNHRKDGSTFIAEWTVAPVRNEDGGLEHWVFVQRDVSERRQLERQVLAVSDEERRRIGQHLHDTLGGQLSGARMIAQNLAHRIEDGQRPPASKPRHLAELIQEAEEKIRQLSHSLMPLDGPDESLPVALRSLCERKEQPGEARCQANIDESIPSLNSEVETHLYRIATEAVTNAFKHGKPDVIEIGLRCPDETLELTVRDDGSGLSDEEVDGEGAGLRIMRYRANLIGAAFGIDSTEEGTEVRCTLSVHKAQREPGGEDAFSSGSVG